MIIVTLSALGYLVAGCASTGDAAGGGLPWGETFVASSITEDGEERPLPPNTRIELTFEDGRISASAGCNSMAGPVRDDQGRLVVQEMSSTLIGCPPEIAAVEALLGSLLDNRPLWSHEDGELWLRTESLSLRLTAVDRQERALVGTPWVLESLIDGEMSRSLPAGVTASLEIASNTVTGVTDCGPFSGEAQPGPGTIIFTGVNFPESDVDCPEGALAVANALRSTLTGEVPFEIDHDRLTLTHPDGPGLQFQAAD